MGLMTALWLVSVAMTNASIVDLFWGFGFVMVGGFYALEAGGWGSRPTLVLILVAVWGLRLSLYLAWRNAGKGEDFRYQDFRKKYGPHRYWWFSFFQVFLLQGVLMWLISTPLAAAMAGPVQDLIWLDYVACGVWLIGFVFEAGGDYQLA
ncbi:MAG: DUF1295 domain-containing protein, partial [Bacteroidota bacterium]